jgi:small subunit ribosomal protein S1
VSEETMNNETPLVIVNEGEGTNQTGGEAESGPSFRESLTRKAARFFEEAEYTEDEYRSMLEKYDETMKSIEQGNIVTGTVLMITDSAVIVDIGFKSEGSINLQEFGDTSGINVGDKIEVFLEDVENQDGQLVLSKQKADFMKVWDKIKDIYDNNMPVEGKLVRRIKGGIVVDLLGVDAFLPGSQIDIRQVKNFDQFIGETFKLKIIKINKTRRNIVVSRRVVLEEERSRLRDTVLTDLEIGQVRDGMVKNITDFGAFIDLGGVDGLLHITDMSWGRINHPSELVSIGDRIKVKVLNFEEGKTRISLGMKQLTPYPWEGVEEKYPVGAVVTGKVVSTTDYGAFVELERGVEGLVHISEMSWTQHIRHPSKIVNVGDEINIKILSVDKANEKISLGIKQLEPDPWASIDERHPVGSRVKGKVRNLTNFGAFVEIEEGIDGLVHISDMSWTKRIKHPSEVMKKGQVVEVIVLDIDKSNRRISLGHKQIFDDPWSTLEQRFAVGMITQGTIIRILDRGVVVALENDIEGFVPAFQMGQDVKKPADAFDVGDELPLKVVEFDKDQRKIVLSVREYFKEKDKAELDEFRAKHQPKPVTIGDAFGDILDVPKETGETETEHEPAPEAEPAQTENISESLPSENAPEEPENKE